VRKYDYEKYVFIAFLGYFVYLCVLPGSASAISIAPSAPSNIRIGSEVFPPPVTPPPTPPGNNGLLSGMTPGNYTVPSGWSVVVSQDFEGQLSSSEGTNGSISSANKHAGSKSLVGTYTGDASDLSWWLRTNKIGAFSEVYVSWYDYNESQARVNDEYWLLQFMKRGPSDELYQEVIVTWMWAGFNETSSPLFIVPQTEIDSIGQTARYGGGQHTVDTSVWTQWEIHYRPSTSGNSNGFLRVYENGNLVESAENKNINNKADMSNMSINVGGVYTKLTWILSGGSCASEFGGGSDSGPRVYNFSNPCPCPNQCPPNGYVPIFKRYFDDIIVMKKQ
jgi:hypothetical protein